MTEPLPFSTRLWFAFACFVRVLADGAFAARAFAVRAALPPAPEAPAPSAPPAAPAPAAPASKPEAPAPKPDVTALQLLSILQTEGRLLDFLDEDVSGFPDADVGAAARVVHEGCRKALRAHLVTRPIRDEAEGARIELAAGYDAAAHKLTGSVKGAPPYVGALRHRGIRAEKLTLPTLLDGADPNVLCPAEVEV